MQYWLTIALAAKIDTDWLIIILIASIDATIAITVNIISET